MDSKSINIYTISFIFVILECAYSFITRYLMSGMSTLICLLCFISFFFVYKEKKKLSTIGLLIYLFLSFGFIYSHRFGLRWCIIGTVKFLPLLTLFMLVEEDLRIFKNNIVKCFCCLTAASLFLYVFKNIGFHIPLLEKASWQQYEVLNHFYIYTDAIRYENAFTGFCVEPGYFSFLCVCMLALDNFNLKKKKSIVFVAAILLSLSLEGYLLLVMGIVLYSISNAVNVRKVLIYLLGFILIAAVFIYYVSNYNGGNNIVAEKIFQRLVFDEELGIAGNNRECEMASFIVDRYFYSNDVWFGIGKEEFYNVLQQYDYDISSWRLFVVVYGAIYTVIAFVLSVKCIKKTNIRFTLPFWIIFWFDFYPHGTLSSESLYVLIIISLLYVKKGNNPLLHKYDYNKMYL